MPHIDVPPPHVDVPAPHIDVPAPHVDIPPPHVDVPPPHVDVPVHVDVPIHVDIHTDIPPPHVDIQPPPHVDIPTPHIDLAPPHIDVPSVHVDIPAPHIDLPGPHMDFGHTDIPPPAPPHTDAAPAHADVGYNHWWQNWPKTHRYIAARMFFPRSLEEVAAHVRTAESDRIPLRAVGGGWSFSDASLPGDVARSLATNPATDRPNVTTSDAISALVPVAQGFTGDDQPSIASIDANNGWLIAYDKQNQRLLGGAQTEVPKLNNATLLTQPQPQPAYLMHTRSLKRSLQVQLGSILSADALRATAPGRSQKHYFHVEAGITMEELNRLLDAQMPRLELQAAGGNRGATLAGAVSTSTHGSEFRIPLLSDRVKAVHLVGPGGQQWWIEGRDSIADVAKLLQAYPGLDEAHVIAGTKPIDGLLPQDWLNAVAVSMGCMGVIYSMVLEVFPLSGSQNVTNQTTWFTFLDGVQAGNPALAGFTRQQIQAVLRDSADANHGTVNAAIAEAITTKAPFSRGLIADGENQHGELAFNPNPAPATSKALAAADCDCWVVYRREVPLPFDPQPPGGGGVAVMAGAVAKELEKEFGGDLAALVFRIAKVYGILKPLHVDVPAPHIDIPSIHMDVPLHVDIPPPHIDIPPPHIDIPPPHIDLGHVDLHVDVPAPHIDIPGPHIDIPPPHIDIPGPHIDIPPPHIDVAPVHVDIPPMHIDVGHVDLNQALGELVKGAANPLSGVLAAALGFAPLVAPILHGLLLLGGFDLSPLINMITRVTNAHDTLDVALDTMTAPMAKENAVDLARPLLTGVLAGTLGTANDMKFGVSIATEVGAVGFPSGGMLGAAIEIALPVQTGFGFLQKHVLDAMSPTKPFFGYISVRLCPQTATLLGMQQFAPITVVIEVVSFGDEWGRQLISDLQKAALTYITDGNDAMLHFGLENDQMRSKHLNSIPTMKKQVVPLANQRPVTKVAAFKLVRSMLFDNHGNNPRQLFHIFDNSFTKRLQL